MKDLLILGIDTSGKTASAALSEDDFIIGQASVFTNLTHSEAIMPLCKNLLKDCGKTLDDVGKIAVSCGPGSYTGLRIGIAAAKAMAFALNAECCGISTLESLAYNLTDCDGIICPVMKARAELVYNAVFKCENKKITRLSEDRIINRQELYEILCGMDSKVTVNGDGADDFCRDYPDSRIKTASPLLKYQLAASLCIASLDIPSVSPEMLSASYLQPTKAEKERLTNIS